MIKGNTALAVKLGVCLSTVKLWRRKGVLAPATVVEYGRTIIYDLDKVMECLHHKPVKAGRRAAI